MVLFQLKYSIKGWNREIFSWLYVPNFKAEQFSTSKLKTILFTKHIMMKNKYSNVSDNKMCCPIIFISKQSPSSKYIEKLIVLTSKSFYFNNKKFSNLKMLSNNFFIF